MKGYVLQNPATGGYFVTRGPKGDIETKDINDAHLFGHNHMDHGYKYDVMEVEVEVKSCVKTAQKPPLTLC